MKNNLHLKSNTRKNWGDFKFGDDFYIHNIKKKIYERKSWQIRLD